MVYISNLKISEFEKKIQKNKVICFCAGEALENLCKKYPELISQVICIVDNFKHGQTIEIQGKVIPIVSIGEIKNIRKDTILLLTSLRYAKQIIIQLDNLEYMNGVMVYIPSLFSGDLATNNIGIKTEKKNCIPKKIHYCWFGKSKIPEKFQKNIETWKKYCPDFEIIEWNESNYDYAKNRYMKQAYEAKKWGFVPDYARLDIINTYGGIYLDTDVELIKPLDSLLGYELFCGFESEKLVNFGQGFGAKDNHPILQEMMDEYEKLNFINENGTLNLIASPIYQTQVLCNHGLVQNGKCQEYENYMVFSTEYFSPINAHGFGNITKNTYSIHQYAATWFNKEQQLEKEKINEVYKFIMERMEKKL